MRSRRAAVRSGALAGFVACAVTSSGVQAAPPVGPPIYLVWPAEVPFDPEIPGPSGYELVERRNSVMLRLGTSLFFGGWGVNCLVASSYVSVASREDADRVAWLLVPVAGPALALGAFVDTGDQRSWNLATTAALLSADLIYQLAATAVLITGLVHKEKVWQKPSLGASLVPDVHAGPGGGTLRWRF